MTDDKLQNDNIHGSTLREVMCLIIAITPEAMEGSYRWGKQVFPTCTRGGTTAGGTTGARAADGAARAAGRGLRSGVDGAAGGLGSGERNGSCHRICGGLQKKEAVGSGEHH